MSKSIQNKILVIGSDGYIGADSFTWDAKRVPNIVDYDTVIVDLPSLVGEVIKKVNPDTFQIIKKQLVRFLDSGGLTVVISDTYKVDKRPKSYPDEINNYDWCPLSIGIEVESGTTINRKMEGFEKYLSKLKEWDYYHYIPSNCITSALTDFYGGLNSAKYRVPESALVENRYEKMLAGFVSIEVRAGKRSTDYYGSSSLVFPETPTSVTGRIVLLPRIRTLEKKEAVSLILEDLTGVAQETLPPDWALALAVPGISDIDREISSLGSQITTIKSQITSLVSQRRSLEFFRKLIYGTGRELELVVATSFEQLGAKILPQRYSEEEFVMIFEGHEYLVEVKGVSKSIGLGHLRQLNDYLLKYEEDTGNTCKGILFGNAWREIALNKRNTTGTPEFPDNVVKRGKQWEIALVSSTSFFEAFCEFLMGKKDGSKILQSIITSNGVASL